MWTDRIISLHRLVLLAVVTLALVATGFAHRMPNLTNQALEQAVIEQGLTVADLCGDKGPGTAHVDQDCLACQIAGSLDLPGNTGTLRDLDLTFVALIDAPRENLSVLPVLDRANSPQGPPVA